MWILTRLFNLLVHLLGLFLSYILWKFDDVFVGRHCKMNRDVVVDWMGKSGNEDFSICCCREVFVYALIRSYHVQFSKRSDQMHRN